MCRCRCRREYQTKSPSHLEINNVRGLQFSQVKEKPNQLQNNGKKYETIMTVACTKNSQQEDAKTETITQAARDPVESALKMLNKVTFSGIIPRTDDDSARIA